MGVGGLENGGGVLESPVIDPLYRVRTVSTDAGIIYSHICVTFIKLPLLTLMFTKFMAISFSLELIESVFIRVSVKKKPSTL